MSAGAKQRRQHMSYRRTPGSQCLAKERYHTVEAADRAIAKLSRPARAYKCRICPFLHLTSKT